MMHRVNRIRVIYLYLLALSVITGCDVWKPAPEELIAAMPLMRGITGCRMPGEAYPQADFQVTGTHIKGGRATAFSDEDNSGFSAAAAGQRGSEGLAA